MRQALVLTLAVLAARSAPSQITITEFMASCHDTLTDSDGYSSDWVELHNLSGAAQSTSGWSLADDGGRRWSLPDAPLVPHGYLVVFLSGKGRTDPLEQLHADFRLDRDGGRLQLFDPDGIIRAEVPFGPQLVDVAQGFAQPAVTAVLVPERAPASLIVPGSTAIGDWLQPLFDDGAWRRGSGGFGFDYKQRPSLLDSIATDLGSEMRGASTTACFRFSFEAGSGLLAGAGLLRVRCLGGFVAWLNGHEIARHNAPEPLLPDSKSLTPRGHKQRLEVCEREIRDFPGLLRSGKNVLAVRSLTDRKYALEHLLSAELVAYLPGPPQLDELLFMPRATPGRPNGNGLRRVSEAPKIAGASSLSDGIGKFTLRTTPIDAVVRFTLDGSEPGADSPALRGPLEVPATAWLRARTFRAGELPSPPTSVLYTRLADDLRSFRSDLPMIVVSTCGVAIETKDWSPAHIHVVPRGGDAPGSLLDPPEFSGHGAIRLRGSSTLNLPKRSYGIELRKANGGDRSASLLDMAPGADWVLYAPHNYDQAHLRNALCYELAHRLGIDAPQCRFCELFVASGPQVTAADYRGLYLLVEKIEVGKHRVDIEKLTYKHDGEPEITGGYMVKIDRPGPGEVGFVGGGQQLQFVYPKERQITDRQRDWLQGWFDQFGSVLADKQFADPEHGYPAWIDTDNFIDYHLFHEYSKNPDAYTLSTYMHKNRGGKLRMGPVWDFDRAMRTNDDLYWVGRPARPAGWTSDNYAGWWGILFRDPAFRQRYRARGRAHLRDELETGRVHALIDEMAAVIAAAEERDRQRWPIIDAGEWHNEIAELKQWIAARTEWFAAELLERPRFQSSTGSFGPPFVLSMHNGNDGGVLYYSLDGADPRLRDGRPNPRASIYSAPLAIDADTQVRARALVDGRWSRPKNASYVRQVPTLAIAEFMYNPPGGRDYEWIEFLNFGDEPVDLSGIEVDGRIRYHFGTSGMKTLLPGQRVLVVRDRKDFADRHDIAGLQIAGEFLGRLSNTEGEIIVTGPFGEAIARLRYQDEWYPSTDGKGRSLQATSPRREQTIKDHWQPSAGDGGTPGH